MYTLVSSHSTPRRYLSRPGLHVVGAFGATASESDAAWSGVVQRLPTLTLPGGATLQLATTEAHRINLSGEYMATPNTLLYTDNGVVHAATCVDSGTMVNGTKLRLPGAGDDAADPAASKEVNGSGSEPVVVSEWVPLKHGDRVVVAYENMFQFRDPRVRPWLGSSQQQ